MAPRLPKPPPPKAPEEALKWFASKVPFTRPERDALSEEAKKRAFFISNVAQLNLVADAHKVITKAIRNGTTLADFKAAMEDKLNREWGVERPAVVECLAPETQVYGAVVDAAHRRRYEGRVLEIVTARGRNLTATPNHPMLTRNGWVAAGELRKGDDLIGHRWNQDARRRGDEYKAEPHPSIEQVFSTLADSRPGQRVATSGLDFHGDGSDGEVNVVFADRPLALGRFAALRKPLEDLLFAPSNPSGFRFCPSCLHLGVVTKRCGFCDRPIGRAGLLQDAADCAVAGIEGMCDFVRAFTGEVARDYLAGWQVHALSLGAATTGKVALASDRQAARNTGSPDHRRNPSGGHSSHSCNTPDALPGEIEFDSVTSLRARSYSGHVFNLSTSHGYYLAEGLYTGNTIFRNGVQSAYNAGRLEQFEDPLVKRFRPMRGWAVILDGRTTEFICKPLATVVVPADSIFAKNRVPPLHHRCRTGILALSEEDAAEKGGVRSPEHVPHHVEPQEGFGGDPRRALPPVDLSNEPPALRRIFVHKTGGQSDG